MILKLETEIAIEDRRIKSYYQAVSRRFKKHLDDEISAAWAIRDMNTVH